jgi:ribose-phosphate pyrophosphokinase
VANLIAKAGADRVLTFDLHAMQIQGFFDIPSDNLALAPLFTTEIKKSHPDNNIVVVSPDIGGLVRARPLAKRLMCELAIVDKRRIKPGESEVMNLIGDVAGKVCILHDDIVDSAGTLCNAADALTKMGARRVEAFVTHGVLSGPAIERIQASTIERLVISDTINQPMTVRDCPKLEILSVATLLAEGIKRTAEERSISDLFV